MMPPPLPLLIRAHAISLLHHAARAIWLVPCTCIVSWAGRPHAAPLLRAQSPTGHPPPALELRRARFCNCFFLEYDPRGWFARFLMCTVLMWAYDRVFCVERFESDLSEWNRFMKFSVLHVIFMCPSA